MSIAPAVGPKSDRAYAPTLRKAAATEAAGYTAFAESVFQNADGAIPLKYRELIAIAVALTTQCEMCLEGHVQAASKHGATQEEIAEVSFVAATIRAGGAYTHGMKAMRMLEGHQ
jgi:AhpD family alkylhydroperoxidase